MSEHFSINGEINFWHLPYEDEMGMAYCSNCKEVPTRLSIEFHEGLLDCWIRIRCPKCKKTIWVSTFNMKRIKDNKKCWICKKPTNHYDCYQVSSDSINNKDKYLCSKKCADKNSIVVNKMFNFRDELGMCCKEQNIETDWKFLNKITKKEFDKL